jgi:hypothetical protein
MKAFLTGLTCGLAIGCHAQSSVILEACNSIQDPPRRLECFREATKTASPATKTPETRLKESLIGIQGAVDSPISYRQYAEMVSDLGRELAIYNSSQPGGEQTQKFEAAVQAYKDASVFWAALIRNGTRTALFDSDLPIFGLVAIVDRYSIPASENRTFLGTTRYYEREKVIPWIWAYARRLTSEIK